MRKVFYSVSSFLLATMLLCSYDLPKNWFKAGSEPDSYEMGIDKKAGVSGGNAAIITSTEKKIKGFGTLMQNSLPGKYLGKRIKMSGYVKSENVDLWAGLWLRVDGKDKSSLSFDNMYDRAIKGTTAWKQYEIILDVPEGATNIAYGALLAGPGTIWFDDLKFEIVSDAVTTTGKEKTTPDKPSNLSFEE